MTDRTPLGWFAICFDFPEAEGEPWFAAFIDSAPGWTLALNNAARFVSEDAADRFLHTSYGPETAGYGAVVEVAP